MSRTPRERFYMVSDDDNEDISFTGRLRGEASSYTQRNNERWTELRLYQTQAGAYVCEEVGRSAVQFEISRCAACVADTVSEVIQFFGHGWLAKRLYKSADIEATNHVA